VRACGQRVNVHVRACVRACACVLLCVRPCARARRIRLCVRGDAARACWRPRPCGRAGERGQALTSAAWRTQEYKLFQQALKETPKGRWSHAGEKVRRAARAPRLQCAARRARRNSSVCGAAAVAPRR
jgi:hypothetical protein